MKYFMSVINFVDAHLMWVMLAFLAAVVVEFFVFLAKRQNGIYNWDGFYVSVTSNIVVLLGLYVLACLCVGFVNCLRDQDWHFWSNYMSFINGDASTVIFSIVFIAGLIFGFVQFDFDSLLARLIVAALVGAAAVLGAAIAGFLIYVVIAFVIILLKVIWFVFSGFFISIYQFIVKYWRWIVIALLTPGALYGMVRAFINYIKSLKEEVFS